MFARSRTGPPISRRLQEQAIDWAAIEAAYAISEEKPAEIAERFGISRQKLQAQAKLRRWKRPIAGIDGRALAEAEEAEGARRHQIVERLFKALDEKMAQIERRIGQGAEPPSPQDSERDARALSALAGLYAKLVALDDVGKREERRGGMKPGGAKAGRDADGLREDLARRLRRLHRSGNA